MAVSGQELEAEAAKAAKDQIEGVKRMQLSPKALKERLARKKAAQRATRRAGT